VPPIVQEFRADPDHMIRYARIVEKHFGALADELEQLRDRSGRGEPRKEPEFPASTPGVPFRPTSEIVENQWGERCPHCPCAFIGKDQDEALGMVDAHCHAEHLGQIKTEIAEQA
jgi:hypothetical protein